MTNPAITILRNDAPRLSDMSATAGWLGVTVTVIAGHVTGEIVRSICDGTVEDEAQIVIGWQEHDTGVRVADVQTKGAQTLRDLAVVAGALADELAAAPLRPATADYPKSISGVCATSPWTADGDVEE